MEKPQEQGYFSVLGDLNFSNEAVFLGGETSGIALTYHEGDLAFEVNEIMREAGGAVTGDAALFL